LLTLLPMSAFFAINAASFFLSAALIATVETPGRADPDGPRERPRIREGFTALRELPGVAIGVVGLGLGVTLATGSWIGGVPELVRTTLNGGPSGFSIVMIGYALGSVAGGLVLARIQVRDKARASLLAWTLGAPAYLLLALAHSMPVAIAGAFAAGSAQTSAVVLLNAAAQAEAPDAVLGRVTGLVSLVHRGAHATALLLVSPLYAIFAPSQVFVGAGITLAALGVGGAFWPRKKGLGFSPHARKKPSGPS